MRQRDEIEELANSRSAFFASMSHEIRTPINTIIGLNEMIMREENISEEAAEDAANIQNERDDRAEAGLAVWVVAELTQQFGHVGLTVVVGAFGVARRVHPRLTVECLHLKPRIVGEAVKMVVVEDVFRLLVGVGLERHPRLGNVLVAADIVERDNLERRSEYLPYLLQFVALCSIELLCFLCLG